MKAIAKPKGKTLLTREERKLKAEFDKQHDETFFTEHFCDANQFKAFRRKELTLIIAYGLFNEGKIDLFHQDNIYDSVEIVKTDKGNVLVLPFQFDIEDLEAIAGINTSKSESDTVEA